MTQDPELPFACVMKGIYLGLVLTLRFFGCTVQCRGTVCIQTFKFSCAEFIAFDHDS